MEEEGLHGPRYAASVAQQSDHRRILCSSEQSKLCPCPTKDFLSDKDTTCSVRLNRESSYGRIAARRLRRAVVRELLLPSLRDSDFAKIEGCNKL